MTFTPSPYQQAVFDFIQQARGSAVVIAVAGSGKTTTIMQALPLIPSSESVQLFAFNKAIADELKARIPAHCRNIRAATFHSVGYGALCRALNL
jgi:superfamily I DNA/RNA helicase